MGWRRFEREGKYWVIGVNEDAVTTIRGTIGKLGQSNMKRHATTVAAKAAAEKLAAAKRGEGFVEVIQARAKRKANAKPKAKAKPKRASARPAKPPPDPNRRDDEGRTRLHVAGEDNKVSAAKKLIAAGARVDLKDRNGRTALFDWAYSGSGKGIDLLVAAGAKVDARDKEGLTALHLAARAENLATLDALLRHGADAHRRDRNGRTAIDDARAHNRMQSVARLNKATGGSPPSLADLDALATKLGADSARSAIDSGDHGYYVDEGMDPDELRTSNWDAQFEPVVRAAMKSAGRDGDKKLLARLLAIYTKSYRAAP